MKLSELKKALVLNSTAADENQIIFNTITSIMIGKDNPDPDFTLDIYQGCVNTISTDISKYSQAQLHRSVLAILKNEKTEILESESKQYVRPPAKPSLQSCTEKLAAWFVEEEKKGYEEMIQACESLSVALYIHGLIEPQEKSLFNILELLTHPLLRPEISADIINDKLNKIRHDITPADLTAALKEMTADQYNKLPAKSLLGKAFTKLFRNVRERIKSNLTSTTNMQVTLDPLIDAYQESQIKYTALHRGYQNANEIISAHCDSQERNPDYYFDTYVLKRHDESNYMHKGFGGNRDTQLTSIGAPMISGQTTFDLSASKVVHSACTRGLRASGLIDYVKLHVSPVRRSYQTAVLSTFDVGIPDEVFVSGKYVETRSNHFSLSATTREEDSARPELEKAFEGFSNFTLEDKSFTTARLNVQSQKHRIEDAAVRFLQEDISEAHRGSTLHFLVAHGGINRAMLDVLTNKIAVKENFVSTIPENINDTQLDYGGYYIILIARDRQTNQIMGSHYQGQFSRYGILFSGENVLSYGPEESSSLYSSPHVMFHFTLPAEERSSVSESKAYNSPGK